MDMRIKNRKNVTPANLDNNRKQQQQGNASRQRKKRR